MAITKIPPAGLEDTGVGAGTVGSASQIPIITVNAQGHLQALGLPNTPDSTMRNLPTLAAKHPT